MSKRPNIAICGVGLTPQGKVPGITARKFAAEACRLAIEDAGLKRADIDGYIFQQTPSGNFEDAPARMLGIGPRFHFQQECGGSSCIAMLATAAGYVELGLANYVIVAFGDPSASISSSPGRKARPFASYGAAARTIEAYGNFAPVGAFAPLARRHMELFGTRSRQLGMIAVQDREHAATNPEAKFYGKPITIEQHQESRLIIDPLRLLDCCIITDGGAAFVVTTAERARDLKRQPVYVNGLGFGTQFRQIAAGRTRETYVETDAPSAKDQAFKMAGIELKDIDVAQIYDAFTIVCLVQIEDYGFCKKGEGGPFVEAGNMRMTAPIPMNTSGGHLGAYYMEGFTQMVEGIRQVRGEAVNQVKDVELSLVTGFGLWAYAPGPGHPRILHPACVVLGRQQ